MKLHTSILILLFSSLALAANAPHSPAADERFSAIENLASAKVYVGNSSGVAAEVDLSGDMTVDNAGVVTIGAAKITEAKMLGIAADGLHTKRIARATLNCAASGCSVGAHTLGVTLPAKSLITRSYINVVTQLTDTGTCTVAIHCEDANNIKTATDITGTAANGWIEGESTGAASAFKGSIAAACLITATVADGGSCAPLTGKAIVFVEYDVVE
jgi:hypothetical protein